MQKKQASEGFFEDAQENLKKMIEFTLKDFQL